MRRTIAFLLSLTYVFLIFAPSLRADFRLLDAIEELGERRYLRPLPARIKAGPLRVHPLLRNSVTYDSNILRENPDRRQDVIFNVQPGIILELPVNKHIVSVGYEADFEFFTKRRHHFLNDQNQNMFALVDLHFPDWYVNVLEKFSETSSRAGTTFTERIPRYDQSINPKIGYKWRRTTFEAGFRHYVRDFRRQIHDALDFQMVEYTGVIFYDLFARLKALIEYQFAQIDYDDAFERVGTFQQVRAGLEGELHPSVLAKIRIGPQFRNYDESSQTDFYSWVGEAAVDYQIRKNVKVYTGLSRQAVEATFQNVNFYKEHLARLGVEYQIRLAWLYFLEGRYYRHDYSEEASLGGQSGIRRDQHWGARTGLRYTPREWLELELAYQFMHRNSNFSTFDYNDNQVSFSTALSY